MTLHITYIQNPKSGLYLWISFFAINLVQSFTNSLIPNSC